MGLVADKPVNVLVKSNLPTVLDFGSPPHGTTLKDPGGKNHGVKIPGFQLKPGVNEIPLEAWEMWTTGRAKCAGLDWHLSEKHIEVVKVEVEAADESGHSVVKAISADDFVDLRADDAIPLVKETFDVTMLKTWGKTEHDGRDRVTVLEAITEQIEMLETQVAGTTDE